jgi:hypothetical protein
MMEFLFFVFKYDYIIQIIKKSNNSKMKPVEVRLVGRFRLSSKIQGTH